MKYELVICDECPCNQSDEGSHFCSIQLGEYKHQPIDFERLADNDYHYIPNGFACQLGEIKYKNGKRFGPQIFKYSVVCKNKLNRRTK